MKTCTKCNQLKPLTEFKKHKLNYGSHCKKCNNKLYKSNRNTPRQKVAQAWRTMNCRALNRGKYWPTYAYVEIRMTREDFINWALPYYEEFMAKFKQTPVVDRIDSTGHYELKNLQIISKSENTKRMHTFFTPQSLAKFIVNQC